MIVSLAAVVSVARSVSSAGVEHFPCGNEGYDPEAPTQVLSVLPSMLYPQSLLFHVTDRHDLHQHCFVLLGILSDRAHFSVAEQ